MMIDYFQTAARVRVRCAADVSRAVAYRLRHLGKSHGIGVQASVPWQHDDNRAHEQTLFKKARGSLQLCRYGVFADGRWIVCYVLSDFDAYAMRAGMPLPLDIAVGSLDMLILLELARRVAGWPMVVIAVVFFGQNIIARYLPGMFRRASMSYSSMIDFIFMRTDGIFGMPVQVISTYVVLFMMFASMLEESGAGKFFIDFATAITGKSRGGPPRRRLSRARLSGLYPAAR
jgi:TRAP-type uncharacterized transport system fused permease subunit